MASNSNTVSVEEVKQKKTGNLSKDINP